LLAFVGQFTSMCSLKSWNLRSVIIFEPAESFTNDSLFAAQLDAFDGLSNLQPEKFRRLNSRNGWPHFTLVGRLTAGARLPVQVHASPFGHWGVPVRISSANLPSKTRSFLLPSSSLGETKWTWSP